MENLVSLSDPRMFSDGVTLGSIFGVGPMWRPLERWRSGWDGEFESPLLQRRVCCEPDFLDRGGVDALNAGAVWPPDKLSWREIDATAVEVSGDRADGPGKGKADLRER